MNNIISPLFNSIFGMANHYEKRFAIQILTMLCFEHLYSLHKKYFSSTEHQMHEHSLLQIRHFLFYNEGHA